MIQNKMDVYLWEDERVPYRTLFLFKFHLSLTHIHTTLLPEESFLVDSTYIPLSIPLSTIGRLQSWSKKSVGRLWKKVVRAIKKKGHHRVHTLTQIMMLFLKALHYHYRKLQIMFSVYDGWCIGKKLWVQTEKVLLHGIAVPLAFLDKGYNIFSSCRGGNLWDQIVK